jgi:hypothetical protein
MQKIMNERPLAVIEILSPEERVTETLQRFQDYDQLGVPYIVQMDPETQVARRYQDGSLMQTKFQSFPLTHTTIPFDSEQVFAELRRADGPSCGEGLRASRGGLEGVYSKVGGKTGNGILL